MSKMQESASYLDSILKNHLEEKMIVIKTVFVLCRNLLATIVEILKNLKG